MPSTAYLISIYFDADHLGYLARIIINGRPRYRISYWRTYAVSFASKEAATEAIAEARLASDLSFTIEEVHQ